MDIALPVAVVEKIAGFLDTVAAMKPETPKTAAAPAFGDAQRAEAKAIAETMKSAGLISPDSVAATIDNLCNPTTTLAYTKKAMEMLASRAAKPAVGLGKPEAAGKPQATKSASAMDEANARFESAIGVKA
jgi:hypothetical protein